MGCQAIKGSIKLEAASAEGQVGAAKSRPQSRFVYLPKGLIGTRSTGEIKIKGEDFCCLYDTGSQVTTVPHSFYNAHLSDHEIKSLEDLLEVEGANGQLVPYLGYIELNITFPADFFGEPVDVSTLALVVPDVETHKSMILVGTNTLDAVYAKQHVTPDSKFQPAPFGYRAVMKILQLRHKQMSDGHHGIVKCDHPVTVPAGQTTVLDGLVIAPILRDEKAVLVQHPSSFSLPGGLMVKACLVDFPQGHPCRLPVLITNESDHDVTIPSKASVAEISAIQSVLSKEHTQRSPSTEAKIQYNFGDSPITPEWKQRITAMLDSVPEVFAKNDLDFGCTDRIKHQIKLSDPSPFKQRPRPIHPQDIDAVRSHLQELLQSGVIRESESPFASPIVVVRKKNGTVRLCIDYRKLNAQTIKDAYALPKLEDTFTALSGSKWFSVLDLKSGYYQIEMEESDKCKTAFVCPLGFWEFNRMPQGVTNAPSTFQRLMERCMGDMNLKEALVFIDDLIIFAPTLEEHERRLLKVLDRLKEFGLKLSPEKCVFCQTSVRYLGHIVSQDGVETDPEKISTLTSWPVPKTLKELRSFLGFASYYRRFVQGFSSIVKPLNNLTAGYPPTQKQRKPSPSQTQKYLDPKQPFGGRWTNECQQAFDTIIDKLTSAPVLAFADPHKPYIVHTDASCTGLGAVLYQEQNGKKRVIAYASRGLTQSESRYSAHKLEFLALKWAVTEKFNDYLYGTHFTIVTDSNPLTYLLTSAKLDATSYRWLSALSTFSFSIVYRAGKHNADADGLSRMPHGELSDDLMSQKERERILSFAERHLHSPSTSIDQHVVQAICDRQLVYSSDERDQDFALVQTLSISTDCLPDSYINDSQFSSSVILSLSHAEIATKQRADPVLTHVIAQVERGESPPSSVRGEFPDLPLLLKELPRLELQNNVLVRRRQIGNESLYQLVLPEECRSEVLSHLHDRMGHLGIERTLDLVRSRFYWPKMFEAVRNKIKTCERCVKRKSQPEKAAPLVNIRSSRPLELVCMDFLSLEPDRSNTKDILVITDHFTKYAVAVPTPNQKAKTVAKCLWDNFLVHYGIPEKLHSDQGPDFESRTIKQLCEMAGMDKLRTTPYHPRGNPVERFNRTLLDMLGTLEIHDKAHWRDFVKPMVHAYNCTRNDVTGYSPYELMFGRQPRLPIDLAFSLPVHQKRQPSHSKYVEALRNHLKESYRIAAQNSEKIMRRNKTRFDRHISVSDLAVGDRVLVRNVRLRGKHKLADRWEPTVYIVVKRAGTLPVYTVKPEHRDQPVRTLHRDLLLPCGFLPALVEAPSAKPKKLPPLTTIDDEQPKSSSEDERMSDRYFNVPFTRSRFKMIHSIPTMIPSAETDTLPVVPSLISSPQYQSVDEVADAEMELRPDVEVEPQLAQEQQPESEPLPDPEPAEEPEVTVENGLADDSEQAVVPGPEFEEHTSSVSIPLESDSSVLAPSPETDPPNSESSNISLPVRRPTRARNPPIRLQYTTLGNPLLQSIQSLYQGLSNVFVNALQLADEPTSDSVNEQAICCQPSPCPGPDMGKGGDPVTCVT